MMEPRIQYAKTADGVSIACCMVGQGMPLVSMPSPPWSHIGLSWPGGPGANIWRQRLAERRRLIVYDNRGSGLSDREVTDFSLEAHQADLQAVVDQLGLERFALFATIHAGPTAIAYAARHPERVSHLILWCTYARGSDIAQRPRAQALGGIAEKDWRLFTETVARVVMRPRTAEGVRAVARVLREMTTQEAGLAAMIANGGHDASELLPQVRCPTLVLHRRELRWPDVGLSRGLASRIPDARLAVLEGRSPTPEVGDSESVLAALDEFLGEGESAPARAEPVAAGGLCTILFTDVEGSTALTQRLGDAKARDVLRTHERIVREALRAHGGAEVKAMGDGFMASFSSATRALECAIAIQRAVEAWNRDVGAAFAPSQGAVRLGADAPTEAIRVRVGLNAGEPIAEEKDLFGTAVNMAARIAAKAEGGEILVSDVVRQLVAGKGFLFSDRGEVALRGFEDPVRLYEVRWREPV